jgi:NADH:ubiquinone oxidoreductase subunit 5 (subunit L)/multisubunit Na+/H+ antiporter MnhA subunit
VFGTTEFILLNTFLPHINFVFFNEEIFGFKLSLFEIICFCLCIAAMCKSAQIGFHM